LEGRFLQALLAIAFVVLFFALAAGVCALYWWWRIRSGRRCIERWAKESGWDLLAVRYCFLGGPFNTTATSLLVEHYLHLSTDVYRVTIGDRTGWTRSGYVRVGYRWLGRAIPIVGSAIRWDDVPAGQRPAEAGQPRPTTARAKRGLLLGAGVAVLVAALLLGAALGWLEWSDALAGGGLALLIVFLVGARSLGRAVAAVRERLRG
jgi:hypothetical protein